MAINIIVELTYHAILERSELSRERLTRCDHCMRSLTHNQADPQACKSCGQMYCSAECTQEAWSQYHEAICEMPKEVQEMEHYCQKGTSTIFLLILTCSEWLMYADKRRFPLLAMRTMARILLSYRSQISFLQSTYAIAELVVVATETLVH